MLDYFHTKFHARITHVSERGASAAEYGLLIAGIAALIAVVVFAFGGAVGGLFGSTCETVTATAGITQTC